MYRNQKSWHKWIWLLDFDHFKKKITGQGFNRQCGGYIFSRRFSECSWSVFFVVLEIFCCNSAQRLETNVGYVADMVRTSDLVECDPSFEAGNVSVEEVYWLFFPANKFGKFVVPTMEVLSGAFCRLSRSTHYTCNLIIS